MTKLFAIVCFLSLVSGVAMADAGQAAMPINGTASLVLLACVAASYALRKFSPQGAFFHSQAGGLVIAGVAAALSAVISVIQGQGLSGPAILQAVIGALMSLFATSNPSVAPGSAPPMQAKVDSSAILPLLLLPLIALAGCGTIPKPPTPNPAQYTQAFEACLTNKGVSQAAPEGAKIWSILNQGGNSALEIEAKVEQVLLTVTADTAIITIDCAIAAWNVSNPVSPGSAPTTSQAAVRLYLAKHLQRPTIHAGAGQ